jgi:hypothetical protein
MVSGGFDTLIQQEQRKFQGMVARSGAHINCEPLRADDDRSFTRVYAKEIGEMSLLATITDHSQGLATPALYRIEVRVVLHSMIDEPLLAPGSLNRCTPPSSPDVLGGEHSLQRAVPPMDRESRLQRLTATQS